MKFQWINDEKIKWMGKRKVIAEFGGKCNGSDSVNLYNNSFRIWLVFRTKKGKCIECAMLIIPFSDNIEFKQYEEKKDETSPCTFVRMMFLNHFMFETTCILYLLCPWNSFWTNYKITINCRASSNSSMILYIHWII